MSVWIDDEGAQWADDGSAEADDVYVQHRGIADELNRKCDGSHVHGYLLDGRGAAAGGVRSEFFSSSVIVGHIIATPTLP